MADLKENLTERELEILACLVEGLSNADIGLRLHIAPQTVRWYNSQIYSKLDVKNRRAAVTKATMKGLLNTDNATNLEHIKNNLPAQTTPFIGREKELNGLAVLLNDDNLRLITILASGGMGKTRLSLETARQQMINYPDGVFFVALAALNSPTHVLTSIAEVLNLHFHSDREPEQQLLDYLSDKQLLLILDNFEHLLDAMSLVNNILKSSAKITILVTSRERLGLSSEKVFTMSGMIFPDWETPEDALEYDAVKLFMQSARLASSGFQLQTDDLRYLARICRLSEGMPLAIVLAAAWVDVLSLEEIATEIQESVDFLVTEMRDLPRRQWSIRAVFEPTWKRLKEDEQTVFMKLAVFRGGCTREAAQVVTGATLRHLQTFINKALLIRSSQGRYEIHELLRQYAEEHLISSDQLETTYDNHSNYFFDFLAQRESDIKGARQLGAIQEIAMEFENIRSAWNRAIEQQQHHLIHLSTESLCWYSIIEGRFEEADELLQNASNRFSSENYDVFSLTWGHVQTRLLFLERFWAGNYKRSEDARVLLEQYFELATDAEDEKEALFCQFLLADVATLKGNSVLALDLFGKCLVRFNALNNDFYVAWVLHLKGVWGMSTGYIDNAIPYMEQALKIRRGIGDDWGAVSALYNLGNSEALFFGNTDKAEDYFKQSRETMTEQSGYTLQFMLGTESYIPLLRGDLETAREMSLTGIEGMASTTHMIGRSLSLSTLGVIRCIDGDYDEAKIFCEEGLTTAPRLEHRRYAEWGLALIACAQENYDEAIQHNRAMLSAALETNAFGQTTWGLPAASMIANHYGDTEIAVQLMSLAFNHPASTSA